MLTIFSIPKAFRGNIGLIQRNAIRSWLRLDSQCEVILYGNDPGVAETALEYKIKHIPDIARNDYGTPILSSAFDSVQDLAKHQLICYVNSDIIFLSDLKNAINEIPFRRFLGVGQRWDLEMAADIDFAKSAWEMDLRHQLDLLGSLHAPAGSDYFIFPKGVIGSLPDFTVGRPGWDNWLIYQARKLGIPVVDMTESLMAIHQNHDYSHVPEGDKRSYRGPEADRNRTIVGGSQYVFVISDATHRLVKGRLVKNLDDLQLEQRLSRQDILDQRRGIILRAKLKALWWIRAHSRYFPEKFWRNLLFHWLR